MRHFRLALFCCCWLPSCGGIAEYSTDDPRRTDGDADDDGLVEESPSRPKPLPEPIPEPLPEPIPDCSGTFSEPEVLFEDPGWISQAITPSASGLEFFYARYAVDRTLDDSGTRLPTVRTRRTLDSDFGEPVILWDLATACESVRQGTHLAALDLSYDGLRLYIGCSAFAFEPGATGPLLVFERRSQGARFALPPKVIGEVGISLGLTRDELTAYGTTLDPSITAVLRYKRGSVHESFGPAEITPGSPTMTNPEPSPDGFELWGVIDTPTSTGTSTGRQVAVSRWNEDTQAYDTPTAEIAPPPIGSTDISPALSSDCRAIYFSRYTGYPSAISRVMIAGR